MRLSSCYFFRVGCLKRALEHLAVGIAAGRFEAPLHVHAGQLQRSAPGHGRVGAFAFVLGRFLLIGHRRDGADVGLLVGQTGETPQTAAPFTLKLIVLPLSTVEPAFSVAVNVAVPPYVPLPDTAEMFVG